MPKQRYKVVLSYRGSRYHGWQHQAANAYYKKPISPRGTIPTIQETVSRALMYVLHHRVVLVGSSRTDTGVHAKGQVAHFDTDQVQVPESGIRRAANSQLPDDILIRSIEPVPDSFDAIRSTVSKRYQYVVWSADERPYLFPDLAWYRWQPLDVDAMRAAAPKFEGEHDFASFVRPGHGRENTIRTIHECRVSARGPRIVVGIEGNGFLWNMVRIMVGTLVEVGLGRHRPEDIPRMLAARDRKAAGATAPAHGLYLQWIKMEGEATERRSDEAMEGEE